ncbi:hypothetical protein DQT32_04090 [Salmonella enterica subsp. enterica serovar Braenderup]|nr:hypothetical protein [Salmonella enterica subsp. enterica serovar Braenderup]
MFKLLKQFVGSCYLIFTATLAYEVLKLKGYDIPIASQWIILSQVFITITCCVALCAGIVFNCCMLFDESYDTKRTRVMLYNMFQDSLLSKVWIVYPVLLTLVSFQYALWLYTIGFTVIVGWIVTARYVQLSLIREAKITELK